jgi:hypothetical protein
MRAEGGTPEPNGFSAARLVISPLGSDGVLGAVSMLAAEAGFTYPLARIARAGAHLNVIYVARSETGERSYRAQSLTDLGASDGPPATLSVSDTKAGHVLPVQGGFLFVGRTYDETRTDTGRIWVQRFDGSGAPLAAAETVVEASAAERMYELLAVRPVQTSTGFLVLYRWYDVSSDGVVDTSRTHWRFQALDEAGRSVASPLTFEPEVGSHISENPALLARASEVLVAWTEEQREIKSSDANSMMSEAGQVQWSVLRVQRRDSNGMPLGQARTVSPRPAAGVQPMFPYWVELADGAVGLGWYERETDFNACPTCFEVGTNYFVALDADLQAAVSNLASLRLQTPEAGFVARNAVSVGNTVFVAGALAHNLWQESAVATLSCAR